jgi:putative glutathione S-transferase
MARDLMIDGEWHSQARSWSDDDGSFRRMETTFRDQIHDEPDAMFNPEPDRYHLYISRLCPWAHGATLVRRLLGLTDKISMDVVDPVREDQGWEFSPEKAGCTTDRINGFDFLRETYAAADPEYTGRVTVPVLWDRERETIVNNESIEIMRMLCVGFEDHATDGVDLYPARHREEIDAVIEDIYRPINNGVYRAGFADTQAAYDEAVADIFDALDRWDEELADQRYLLGDSLTLADVRLFPTLVRFDHVYHTHFKCNRKRLVDYDNLWPYLRDLYQTPGVAETVDMDHIVEGYYGGMGSLNPAGIVPVGPDIDFKASHDRDRLPGQPPSELEA